MIHRRCAILVAIICLLTIAGMCDRSFAGESVPEPAALKADMDLITGSVSPPAASDDPGEYCVNIADKAAEARFAWETKTINSLQANIDKRIAELESKRAEYQQWMKERDEVPSKAGAHLVDIYAKMKSDAAARQLAALEDDMAAALLAKLNARTASAILNEMEPGRAAQLTKAMVNITTGVKDSKDAKKS